MEKKLISAFTISPLKELSKVEEEIKKIFKETFPPEQTTEVTIWSPRIDMYEKDNNIIIEAAMPGTKKEDIEIKTKDNTIIIKGEVKKEEEKKDADYYREERFYGRFERIIPLPTDVKIEEIKAKYQDGILKLTIPKSVQEKEVKIEIE